MSNLINFLIQYKDIISFITEIFTALGTVGAVIVALWLGYKDSKPSLRPSARVGIITPEMKEYIWLSCINTGKQSIMCTGFAFRPNRFKKDGLHFILHPKFIKPEFSNSSPPKLLHFSEKAEQWYDETALFGDIKMIKSFLSKSKWLAKLQLKFLWRVIVTTNICSFEGKISASLIEKILKLTFN